MSSEARWQLFFNSLFVSAKYPIFGVDMGNFVVADNDAAQEKGNSAQLLARNSQHVHTRIKRMPRAGSLVVYRNYCLYAAPGRVCQKIKWRRSIRSPRELEITTIWREPGLIGCCGSGWFLSLAFNDVLPVFARLGVALKRAAQAEIALGPYPVIKPAPGIVPRRPSLLPVKLPAR